MHLRWWTPERSVCFQSNDDGSVSLIQLLRAKSIGLIARKWVVDDYGKFRTTFQSLNEFSVRFFDWTDTSAILIWFTERILSVPIRQIWFIAFCWMKRFFDLPKNDSVTIACATLEGYIVNVNTIKRNSNNDNHHYSFILCVADQSIVRVTKFLSKVPACTFRTHLQESMKSGRGACISGLREDRGQYFCAASTKLDSKDLSFRPMCVRVQTIDSLKSSSHERLCTIEAKVCSIGDEASITYEDIGFKRVQKLKKISVVGDQTGALEMTLWEMHFEEISLNDSFQIRLVKVRTYRDQISLVATSDTSSVFCFGNDCFQMLRLCGIL